jgi:hypothetical protein
MANMKKPAPKKPRVSRTPSTSVKKPLPKIEGAKPGAKKLMPKDTKAAPGARRLLSKTSKPEGPSNYTPNSKYKLPMTPAQMVAYNKLPKDVIFTLPKGTSKLSAEEKKQMQARRIADRKRTLARGEAIIRRNVGKP